MQRHRGAVGCGDPVLFLRVQTTTLNSKAKSSQQARNLSLCEALADKSIGGEVFRKHLIRLFLVNRGEYHFCLRMQVLDFLRRLKAVHSPCADVEDHEIGRQLRCQGKDLISIPCFPDNTYSRLLQQKFHEVGTITIVVICYQDRDLPPLLKGRCPTYT